MNPDFTTTEMPFEGALPFGEYLVRINSKKHKKGDKVIIRIGRGTSVKIAEWWVSSVLRLDYCDLRAKAEDVARYLQLKMAAQ